MLKVIATSLLGTIILGGLGLMIYHLPFGGIHEVGSKPAMLQKFWPPAAIVALAFVVSFTLSWTLLR